MGGRSGNPGTGFHRESEGPGSSPRLQSDRLREGGPATSEQMEKRSLKISEGLTGTGQGSQVARKWFHAGQTQAKAAAGWMEWKER